MWIIVVTNKEDDIQLIKVHNVFSEQKNFLPRCMLSMKAKIWSENY